MSDVKTNQEGAVLDSMVIYTVEPILVQGETTPSQVKVINNVTHKIHSVWKSFIVARRTADDLNKRVSIEIASQ